MESGEKRRKKGAAQQGEQTSSDVEETDRAPQQDIAAIALLKHLKYLQLLAPRMISLTLIFIIFSSFISLEVGMVE